MEERLAERLRGKRVVILGVGNPLRGDDGFGPTLIARLQGRVQTALIDAGEVPENYLGPLESTHAQAIVMVDAINLGASPGDVALLDPHQLADVGMTTHNASLALLANLLQTNTGADVCILAVQPESLALGEPLSAALKTTLEYLTDLFVRLDKITKADPSPGEA